VDCLRVLGIGVEVDEGKKEVVVFGCGGEIPNRKAEINVRSAGTAARFLTVALAFCGGEYVINSSEQMKKRPMAPVIEVLRLLGVTVECLEEEGFFPFRVISERIDVKDGFYPLVKVDTNVSSQFASALLIAGLLWKPGLRVELCGKRTEGSYIKITLAMLSEFGVDVKKEGNIYTIFHNNGFGLSEYVIEPDVSSACYFYAMAPLLKADVLVRGVFKDSKQGDIRFVRLLEELGCVLKETGEGIRLEGNEVAEYDGLSVDMQDFSDQVMTLAAIAPFARSETRIYNVAHIRKQESDRLLAVETELKRCGVECELIEGESGILIKPLDSDALRSEVEIETYEDHRMAMAFSLIGLKTGQVTIVNPACSAKTFVNYFDIIDKIEVLCIKERVV